jgi:hypothetical protein
MKVTSGALLQANRTCMVKNYQMAHTHAYIRVPKQHFRDRNVFPKSLGKKKKQVFYFELPCNYSSAFECVGKWKDTTEVLCLFLRAIEKPRL